MGTLLVSYAPPEVLSPGVPGRQVGRAEWPREQLGPKLSNEQARSVHLQLAERLRCEQDRQVASMAAGSRPENRRVTWTDAGRWRRTLPSSRSDSHTGAPGRWRTSAAVRRKAWDGAVGAGLVKAVWHTEEEDAQDRSSNPIA